MRIWDLVVPTKECRLSPPKGFEGHWLVDQNTLRAYNSALRAIRRAESENLGEIRDTHPDVISVNQRVRFSGQTIRYCRLETFKLVKIAFARPQQLKG